VTDRPVSMTQAQVRLMGQLLEAMGEERLSRLLELVTEVVSDSGYGDVRLVIREGRIVRFTIERSIK